MNKHHLCNPVSEATVDMLLGDTDYAIEQKLDGQRVMITCEDGAVTAQSRTSKPVKLPNDCLHQMVSFPGRWILDGELINNKLWLFDILETPHNVLTNQPYKTRRQYLVRLFGNKRFETINVIESTTENKADVFNRLRDSQVEGVVFKHVMSQYLHGKRKHWYKYKFVKMVDCVVMEINVEGKNAARLGMVSGRSIVEVGKVTLQAGDGGRIKHNDIVEVRCLYVTPNGKLYQPTMPRINKDKTLQDCDINQLWAIQTNKNVIT